MQTVAENRVAFDLSRFDRRTVVKEQLEKERAEAKSAVKSKRKAKIRISSFSVFASVVVFGMLLALLYSYVNLTEMSDTYKQREGQLEDLHEEVLLLEIEKNQKFGALKIRDYAVNNLGMSKVDKTQITYVSTSGGDEFEIGKEKSKNDSKLMTGLAKGFSRIFEYIN